MNKKIIYGMAFAALTATVGTASAAIIDFQTLSGTSVGGKPNLAGSAGNTSTYLEDGFRVGIANDPLDTISHLHRHISSIDTTNIQLQYHSDSSGIYIRAADDSAFSLTSLDFLSPYDASDNPHTTIGGGNGSTTHDFWDIYGFSDARNPGLLTANLAADGFTPTSPNGGFPTRPAVAHATVANGTDALGLNVLSLNAGFGNIKSFWIHYNGFPHSPNAYIDPNDPNSSAYQFSLVVDNINLGAPVPVPAAVWMFLSGMMGLLALGKKKANLAA